MGPLKNYFFFFIFLEQKGKYQQVDACVSHLFIFVCD